LLIVLSEFFEWLLQKQSHVQRREVRAHIKGVSLKAAT
jgi:hypothetical protein